MGGTVIAARRICCALALAGVFFAALLFAAAMPALAGDLSSRLVIDARDGCLDDFPFITAALIAGGAADECELTGWLQDYSQRRDQILDSTVAESPAERLGRIHAWLHTKLLHGKYDAGVNDLRATLSEGNFNCLTSLAIYFDLCQEAGLSLQMWLGRGHVRLAADLEREIIVVEPGTPDWRLEPGELRPTERSISPVELLGKFYYNRGVELLKEGRFAEGIELLKTSLILDPADANARTNLAAGFNNWAVEELRAKRYDQAASRIEQGLSIDPTFAPLVANEQLVRAKLRE